MWSRLPLAVLANIADRPARKKHRSDRITLLRSVCKSWCFAVTDNVRAVDIANCESVLRMRRLLGKTPLLRSLTIRETRVCCVLYLGEFRAYLPALTELTLRECDLRHSPVSLAAAVAGVTSLTLAHCDTDESLFDGLGSVSSLSSLSIHFSGGETSEEADARALREISTSLTSLTLTGRPIEHWGFDGLENLTMLDVNDCELTTVGMEKLGRLSRLTHLDLSFNPDIEDEDLAHLPAGLKSLSLECCSGLTDDCLTWLRGTGIESLNINDLQITDWFLAGLMGMTNIRSLTMEDLVPSALPSALAQMTFIESLSLSFPLREIRDPMTVLTPADISGKIKSLSLSYRDMTDADLMHLTSLETVELVSCTGTMESLRLPPSVKSVTLSFCLMTTVAGLMNIDRVPSLESLHVKP